ncbi:hypothetical protein [Bacillus smithii]|uniref:hypothetical protein n=1 Tax=Bacillus smithii TaxID=1479 RepID=UPI003D199771
MKIGELLELTQVEPLAKIAKERLTIGEKSARQALKAAGCYSISGKRGWYCDDSNVLEKSIYDFAPPRKIERKTINEIDKARQEVSATIEKAAAVNNPTSQLSNEMESKEINKVENNQSNQPENKQVGNTTSQKENKPTNKQTNKQTNKPTSKQDRKPAMKKVTYEIEEKLHDQLKIKAIVEKRTVSEIVNEIIKNALA